ncbi:hypothetical protein PENSPDRAFT_660441 [Peniophora sp. CONT]|nr:hypothetical protein PENSPDRAFT_660441 [Peniophora sp. CONT]
MSTPFEDGWSGHLSPLFPGLFLPFEGDIYSNPEPIPYHEAPQDRISHGLEMLFQDKHPDIRGEDVWLLEHSGSISPLPVTTLRPPTPPSACVSPHDIFSPVPPIADEDVDDGHPCPPSSPSSPESTSSGSSFNADLFLPDYANVTVVLPDFMDSLPPPSQPLPSPTSGSSTCSPKRKRLHDDDEQPLPERSSPRTRRRSTVSSTDESDEDSDDEEPVPRARAKSSVQRRRKPERRVACKDCGQDFGRSAELTRHAKNSCSARPRAASASPAVKKYECKKCGNQLSRSDALVRHKNAGEGACAKYLASLKKKA